MVVKIIWGVKGEQVLLLAWNGQGSPKIRISHPQMSVKEFTVWPILCSCYQEMVPTGPRVTSFP